MPAPWNRAIFSCAVPDPPETIAPACPMRFPEGAVCPATRGRARTSTRRDYTGGVPTRDEVIEALRQVEDPELGMDIVDLGLLYDVEVEGPRVKVTHSLTSMGCPAGPMIQEDINRIAREIPGVEDVDIELTWDPPWTPERMSDDAKFILGIG